MLSSRKNNTLSKVIDAIPLEAKDRQLSSYYKKRQAALTISDFKLKINLGVTARERSKKQTVLVTIKINFSCLPLGCITGDITDTICYDTLTQKIKKFCRQREFTLIETLGMQLFILVKEFSMNNNKIYLCVKKLRPLTGLACSIFEVQD